MATKYAAYGTVFARTTAPAATIASVKSIVGPGLKLDTEDVTTHDSTSGWEEAVGTILRSGEVKLELIYDPATATHKYASGGLIYAMTLRTAVGYSLTFPDSTIWTFNAFVTAFEPSAPHEGALTATCTLKITGVPTLA